ncbi:MAG: M28 family peptidase [Planctomycetota bacterium]
MRTLWLRCVVTCCLAACFLESTSSCGWSVERKALEEALNRIRVESLQNHVHVLADDQFEGREAGSRGGVAAARYLVKQFEDLGLQPAGDQGSYKQAFNAGFHNLLGMIEGSDPVLRKEVVLFGAHYDHVGYGTPRNSYGPYGVVHNGADDNASGTACLLTLANTISKLPEPPKRTILFALWDGEEKGLLGSQHWTTTPTMSLQRVVFAFNLDMIGRLRDERVEVYGVRTTRGLRRLLSRANFDEGLQLDFNWELKANSDHHSFYTHSIPVLMFHTGLHEDYHRPSDDVQKIDWAGAQRVTRLALRSLIEVADAPQVAGFRVASRTENPTNRSQIEIEHPLPPPRLGARWVPTEDRKGVEITGLVNGSAAERGGLQVRDRIVRCNDQPVVDSDQLRKQVLAAPSPLQLLVERPGLAAPVAMEIPIDGRPIRIGLTWRDDDAEPGSVLVTMVVPGSPANLAGLQTRDRIYELNGQPIADAKDFGDRLTTAPGPIELLIDRRGKLQTLTLQITPP